MIRLSSLVVALAALVFGCAAGGQRSPRRPKVDPQAMREAMSSQGVDEESFASSASYAHFLRARLAHHDGDHRRALDELRLALASDDDNPFLLTTLAEEYARLSDLEKAERELRRVIDRHPHYAPAQLLMGRVLFEGQRLTRARVHLLRAIKLAPREPDGYLVLTQVWLEMGRVDEAVRVIEELGAALPGEPIGYKRLGMALAERGEVTRAEKLLQKAVDRDPGDFDAWVALAQALETLNLPEEAEVAYERALHRDPENREVLLAAGRLSLRHGSAMRAKAYFDQLLATSDEPEVAVKVAFTYLASRQLGAAAEVLDAARKSAREPRIAFYAGLVHEKLHRPLKAAEAYAEVPRDSELFHEARLHRASCLSLAGHHKQALELFKQGVQEKPDYVLLYPAHARALERSGAVKDAEKLLQQTLAQRSSPEVVDALATLYQRQGKFAHAIDLLTEALGKRPKDETLMYALGAAYERKGDLDRSLAQMRQLLMVNPENASAMNFIAYTLADRGLDFDEAERLLGRALELRPDSGAFLDSLGWMYFRRGEYQRAVDTLERAVSLSPGEPLIAEHLGDAYSRLSRRAQAADQYRRALDIIRGAPDLAESKTQRPALERKLKLLSPEAAGR